MSENPAPHSLAPAGYLILQDSEQARLSNDYRRFFGPYYGVDRLPPFLPPETAIRQSLGEAPVQDAGFHAALEEWFDAPYGNTAFIPARHQALRLFKVFHECGFQLELVYCQVAWKKGEEERPKAYATTNQELPSVSLTYGFDVSWPTCKHSAILQPGVVLSSSAWRQKLNHYGLLNQFDDAAQLRTEYVAVYPYPPFDIYVVHKVAKE
jgi:hypothetical protein